MVTPNQYAPPERRQVFVVDDDADVRCALTELLSSAGISAAQAVDGVDALERVRSGAAPCALLLDIDMPRLSGDRVVAALRADSTLSSIPVITMSAGPQPPDLDTVTHLAKPFGFNSLLAALFRICRSCAACEGEPDPAVAASLFDSRRRADLASR